MHPTPGANGNEHEAGDYRGTSKRVGLQREHSWVFVVTWAILCFANIHSGSQHLEARYNYEAQRTGSLWAGYNFSVGKKVKLDATPMVGGVFGNVNAVAPRI